MKDQHRDRLDEEGAVAIRPDLLFRAAGLPRFVADIKYKLTDDTAGGRNPDYYQLLAYTTALDLPEGVLIYCLDANLPDDTGGDSPIAALPIAREATASAGTPPVSSEPAKSTSSAAVSSVRVRHAGKVLHTYSLDLSGNTDDVANNVGELADWIADRAASAA